MAEAGQGDEHGCGLFVVIECLEAPFHEAVAAWAAVLVPHTIAASSPCQRCVTTPPLGTGDRLHFTGGDLLAYFHTALDTSFSQNIGHKKLLSFLQPSEADGSDSVCLKRILPV